MEYLAGIWAANFWWWGTTGVLTLLGLYAKQFKEVMGGRELFLRKDTTLGEMGFWAFMATVLGPLPLAAVLTYYAALYCVVVPINFKPLRFLGKFLGPREIPQEELHHYEEAERELEGMMVDETVGFVGDMLAGKEEDEEESETPALPAGVCVGGGVAIGSNAVAEPSHGVLVLVPKEGVSKSKKRRQRRQRLAALHSPSNLSGVDP